MISCFDKLDYMVALMITSGFLSTVDGQIQQLSGTIDLLRERTRFLISNGNLLSGVYGHQLGGRYNSRQIASLVSMA